MCVRVVALSLLVGWLNLRKHRQIRKTRILLLISSFSSDISHKVFLMLSHMRRNSNKTAIFFPEKSGMYDRILFYFLQKKIYFFQLMMMMMMITSFWISNGLFQEHRLLSIMCAYDKRWWELFLFSKVVVESKMMWTNMWRCQIYA